MAATNGGYEEGEGAPVFRLGDLAGRVGGRVHGDRERPIRGVAPLESAGPNELSFLTNPKYGKAARRTRAGAVLVGPGVRLPDHDLLEVAEPKLALAEILAAFHPPAPRRPGIHPDARVAESSRIGRDVEIGPFAVVGERVAIGAGAVVGAGCVVGDDCRLGDETRLMPRVVLYPGTEVGARCIIHSGVVLGSDGYGFATSEGKHRKVPQVGRVVVEDDVEIGANTTVDRATVGQTVIGAGTKIDNLVQVAHGVRLGPDCLLAGQAGIAGSTRVARGGTFAGQAGAAGHLEIGEGAIVGAKSAALQDVPAGSYVSGIPAIEHATWRRAQAMLRKLPELRAELRRIRDRLSAIEKKTSGTEE